MFSDSNILDISDLWQPARMCFDDFNDCVALLSVISCIISTAVYVLFVIRLAVLQHGIFMGGLESVLHRQIFCM